MDIGSLPDDVLLAASEVCHAISEMRKPELEPEQIQLLIAHGLADRTFTGDINANYELLANSYAITIECIARGLDNGY